MGNSAGKGMTIVEERSGELSCEDCGDYVIVQVTRSNEETSLQAMEKSFDSGYEEPTQCTPSDRRQQHDKTEKPCRTDRCLGEHHSYYGSRYYQYSEQDCEGNRHITDEDL